MNYVAVACINQLGSPDFFLTCFKEKKSREEKVRLAKAQAAAMGYSAPFVCYCGEELKEIHMASCALDNLEED